MWLLTFFLWLWVVLKIPLLGTAKMIAQIPCLSLLYRAAVFLTWLWTGPGSESKTHTLPNMCPSRGENNFITPTCHRRSSPKREEKGCTNALTGLSTMRWRPSPHLRNYRRCLTARGKLTHRVKIHKTPPATSMIQLLKFFPCHYRPFLYYKVVKPANKTYLFCVERTTSTLHLRLSRHCEGHYGFM